MAVHDSKKAPLAPNVRFTEQTQVKMVGEGLWKTASEAPTTFKIYVADPLVGQIGGIVMMKDAGKPIQVAVRPPLARFRGPSPFGLTAPDRLL